MDTRKIADEINRRRFRRRCRGDGGGRSVRHHRLRGGTIRQAKVARHEGRDAYVVRRAEADRCRRAECRICRSRSRQWPRGLPAARLALRHSHLCRRRPDAGVGRLPGDRSVSARLWHDALSLQRHAAGTASNRRSPSTSLRSWTRSRSTRRSWPAAIGARERRVSSRRSGPNAPRPSSPSAAT